MSTMKNQRIRLVLSNKIFVALLLSLPISTIFAKDNGYSVDQSIYQNRPVLTDFTAAACPDNPRDLTQVKGNLYRHTTGAGLAVHSGLVLITKEGALVIDPAMTCTSVWLKDEIKKTFRRPCKVCGLYPCSR